MSILRSHLKIFKPERLGSAPNAGGHRTNEAIESGKLNDVFSAISDVDHARSAFDLVKLYPAIATNDDSELQDAMVFISDQPNDTLVSTLLVESPQLRDDSVLTDMLNMMTHSDTKYHGSSLLTAPTAADSLELNVEQSQRSLAPTVTNKQSKVGLKPSVEQASIYRTKRIQSAGIVTEFNVDVADILLERPTFYAEYQKRHSGSGQIITSRSFYDGPLLNEKTITGQFYSHSPLAQGLYLTVYYMSSRDFRFHSFDSGQIVLSAGESVLPKTVKLKKQSDNAIYVDDGMGRFIAGGYAFATIDYSTGAITEIQPVDYTGTIAESLGAIVQLRELSIREKAFSLQTSSFAKDSIYIRCESTSGTQLSASSDGAGNITGTNISGTYNASGYVELTFSIDIKPDTLTYDYDELIITHVPSPPGGIDRTKLPENGFVPIFHQFNLVCIQNRVRTVHQSLSAGNSVSVTADADFLDIIDNNNKSLYSSTDENYSYDKSGNVTINPGVTNFAGPFIITAVLSELVLIDNIDGNKLQMLTALKRTYPAGSSVSSAYMLGNLQARTKDERTLSAWNNNFGDTGAAASNTINTTQYPIELSNLGTIAQRWAIVFTSTTAFEVYGEHIGKIYNGDIQNDCVPINPLAAAPYLIIKKEALASGLNPGECFLFETISGSRPIIATRTVSPGHSAIDTDNSTIQFRGFKA